jgi:hypothetical protein
MSRKIVSQNEDCVVPFQSLGFKPYKRFEEDVTIDGVSYSAGDLDPTYPQDSDLEYIHLVTINKRRYDSVHENFTKKQLTPSETNDYIIESELDGNFTFTVLKSNEEIYSKYKKDKNYLKLLNLPEYVPEVHTVNLKTSTTVDPEVYEECVSISLSTTQRVEEFEKRIAEELSKAMNES